MAGIKFSDLSEKTKGLEKEAERVGLKLSVKKCKTLRTSQAKNNEKTKVRGDQVEDVKEFLYLGEEVDKEGGGNKDMDHRLQKAHGAF